MRSKEFDRIDAYLNGDMSAEEQILFKTELAQNKDLASTVALYQSIEQTMRSTEATNEDEATLRQTLNMLGALYFTTEQKGEGSGQNKTEDSSTHIISMPERSPNSSFVPAEIDSGVKRLFNRAWVIAAVFLGLIVIGTIGYWQIQNSRISDGNVQENGGNIITAETQGTGVNDTTTKDTISLSSSPGADERLPEAASVQSSSDTLPQPELKSLSKAALHALFAKYFQPDELPDEQTTHLEEGFSAYKEGNYSIAIAAFQDIASSPLTRGESDAETQIVFFARYYQGISYLATGNAAKAITALQGLTATDPFLRSKRDWYLALSYLQAGRQKAAEILLRQLSQNSSAGDIQQKARSLQNDLRKN
jgi:tetratricopeptide (TPR) repeat protein